MTSFSATQFLTLVALGLANAALALYENRHGFFANAYGEYGSAGVLTFCIASNFFVAGGIYLYNHFAAEFAADAKRKSQQAQITAFRALTASKPIWDGVAKIINAKNLMTTVIGCTATVVRNDAELMICVTYSAGLYQIGYDNIAIDVASATAENITKIILERNYDLNARSGLRTGIQRYRELKQ